MIAKLRAPGFYRGGLGFLLGIAFSVGITWLVRMASGHAEYHHYLAGEAILTVSLIAAPLFFLVGLSLWNLRRERRAFEAPPKTSPYTVSVIIPAYNEENVIVTTVAGKVREVYVKEGEVVTPSQPLLAVG